ncbi:MAG TPA: amino acid adenylation domain-containing protein, partial [Thermoanaerobaculia bacterium]|nr:amino acid adenylation domain-containing protein [Thermoanaerobaculia bacterium]
MISKSRAEIPADWREQPLTDGQRALWFLQRLRQEVATWNIAAAGRVQGKLDPRRLREAFERLADRHEALRLSFHETPAGPVQRLRPGDSVDFQDEDARGWTEVQIAEALQAEADRPFDLSRDPLLRVRLLRRAMDDVLLLVVHHLVADLGSLAILVRELGPLYAGETADPLSALRYAAYADGLEARLQGRSGERHWVYWRERLSGALPVLELPADRPRPPVRSFRGGLRTGRLSRGLTERLRRMGGEQRATLFMVLTAGLDVLLYRASGETDLLVGSPTYGRLAPELHGAVGYFVNPVVLRSDLSGRPTFGELLQRIRSTVLGALRHQEYPFARLVARLQPEREQTRPPIFQVMIALQRGHLPGTGDLAAFAMGVEGVEVSTGPLALTSLPLERRFSEFDLELTAAETARGTELALAFNADLFDSATAERFLGHLVTLLEAATQDSGRRIGELPMLTEAERLQLAGWNETSCPLPERPVYELFEEQAALTPEATAISAADGNLTYGELSARSNRVAQALEEAGLLPEEPVAVWTERGAFLLTALLGILKAGGVYLSLHPDHPAPRLRGLLEKSKARMILAADLVRCGALFPDLKGIEIGAPARERSLPPWERRLEAAAYLLFTSGSTGEPKGALVTHRGLLNHLLSKVHGLNLAPSDRVAQTAPQSFDISIWQLLAPLLAGARVEVVPDSVVREPDRLLAEIDDRGISVLQVVPSLLLPLVDEAERGAGGMALRRLITIGEALAPEVARRWLAARPEARLVNCYGPTECADGVSDAYLDTVPDGLAHTSIGRPIPNLRLYVLSPDLEPQPIGFPGEVCIAGAGVGRGYLDDPGQTAAAFLPDLFSSEPGRRLYRTGDLGRRRVDGELEILGRIDHQIKVRGVRVEPAEVEAALVSHPRVREAIVALHQGRLAAWWTGDPAAEPELREHLRKRLPEVMVPSAFRHLSALPLTPHGKVDRRALPDPAKPNPEWMDAPADELQQLLTGIFCDLLGREQVGLRESFFDLGGHSLLTVKAIARVRKALDVDASAGLLFEEPTVIGLARRLRNLAGAPSLPSIARRERNAPPPLSFAQERLWFLHRLEPGSPSYNMPGIVRLAGSVKPAELAAAISAVMNRHESLRTVFPDLAGEPWQEISPASAVELPVADLSCLADPEPEARRLGLEEARRPFDLGRGPLLRVFLLRLETEHRLVINLHHIVADGWSVEILAREVAAFLHGSVLPALSIQYADFAAWQREQADSLSNQLAWWTSELGGELPPLELPADRPRPALQRQRGARVAVQIPAQTSQELRRLARAAAATPFMILSAAFQLLLHRLTGQDDLRIGTLAANRPRVELEGLIGLFANTIVLRTRLGTDSNFRELIERVRETAIRAYLHQELPFEKLIEELRTPLFQTMLLLQPTAPAILGEFAEIDNGTAKLELTLMLREREDGFAGWVEYD